MNLLLFCCLIIEGVAEFVITEDSDLLLFGCSKIIFKLDLQGGGALVEAVKLPSAMNLRPDRYSFDKFRYMCILSGCDYIESLRGIGLKKALKFISLTEENNPEIVSMVLYIFQFFFFNNSVSVFR